MALPAALARRAARQALLACMQPAGSRCFSGASAAGLQTGRIWSALRQDGGSCPVQQLISLRHLSTGGVPGGIPGTGGGSAETSTGAGMPPAGTTETSTGARTGPSAGGAESSTGLGTPGQTGDAETSTGLGTPADGANLERHAGASDGTSSKTAEQTAVPPGTGEPGSEAPSEGKQSPPPPSTAEQAEGPATASPSFSGAASDSEAAAAGAGSGRPAPGGTPDDQPPEDGSKDGAEEVVKDVRRDDTSFFQSLMELGGNIMARPALTSIQHGIETSFNADDFVECAKDAVWIVSKLWSERDWETLRPMVSQKLLQVLRETDEAYVKEGLTWSLLKQEIQDGLVVNVTTADKEEMKELDADMAALAPDTPDPQGMSATGAGAAAAQAGKPWDLQDLHKRIMKATNPFVNQWIVISVKFQQLQEVELRYIGSGKVKSVLSDQRPRVWRFCRGPMPLDGLPQRELALEWKALDLL